MRRWSSYASASTRVPRKNAIPPATVTRPVRKKYSVLASARAAPVASTSASAQHPSPPRLASAPPSPHALVKPELDLLRERLLTLLGSAHPTLTDIARYYFLHPSKQMRPLLVLLFARATNGLGRDWPLVDWAADCEGARGRTEELDHPLNRADVLNDYNPNMPDHTASFSSVFSLVPPSAPSRPPLPPPPRPSTSAPLIPALAPSARLLPTQLRLAQIVEMIHVASLLHDDVIDSADLRRGVPSGPAAFGNKLAILGGDFLLGRASAALSRLGDHEVVELIASVIANLVEGEILQLGKAGPDAGRTGESEALVAARVGQERWNVYLKKTYLKTASLMAKGARAAVVLGGSKEGEIWKEVAYAYGRNLGIAFQVRSPRAPPPPCPRALTRACRNSSWTTCSTTTRPRRPWASPAAPTCASGSRPGPRSTHGRSTPRWARSSRASSSSRATSSSCVFPSSPLTPLATLI